jgi:hypothetical protein
MTMTPTVTTITTVILTMGKVRIIRAITTAMATTTTASTITASGKRGAQGR